MAEVTQGVTPGVTLVQAIRDALDEALAADSRVVVMGEDVARKGGVFKATEGLLDRYGPERVIDTPLAESGFVGVGIGMAAAGLRPVVEVQFADFIHPAFDQIVSEAARLRYRSNNGWSCPLVIRAPYGAGVHGALYHSQSVESFYVHVPGLIVLAPVTATDAKVLLKRAIQSEDPVLFFEHKRAYRRFRETIPDPEPDLPIGRARVRRAGRDISLITYGYQLYEALAAADALAGEGVDCEVIDLISLQPLDYPTVFRSVAKTNRVIVITEDNLPVSIASEVAARIADECFWDLDVPVRRVGPPFVPAAPFARPLEQAFLPNAGTIAATVRELLKL